MTRLQNLNVYLTERLMAAAKEILEVVGYTISEYQKETARTMKENDELRRRLREIGLQANIVLLDSGHPVAPPVSIAGAHQRQLSPEDEWKPNLKKDTEPLLSGINQELPEQHNSRQEPEEVRLDQQASALACVKSPSDHDFFQPSLPFDVQIVDTVEEGSSPDILPEQIKFEPDGLDYHTQEQPIDPQSLTRVNNDSNTSESKSCAAVNWMESGGVMSEPTTQESSREPAEKMSPLEYSECWPESTKSSCGHSASSSKQPKKRCRWPRPPGWCRGSPEPPKTTDVEIHTDAISVMSLTRTPNGNRKYKKQYCLFCDKPYSKIARHIEQVHRNEVEVAQVLKFPRNSKERRMNLDYLRNRGNFVHNYQVLKERKGVLIPCKQPSDTAALPKHYVHCVNCRGLFAKKYLYKHLKNCKHSDSHFQAKEKNTDSLSSC